jgi:hypothetical protein
VTYLKHLIRIESGGVIFDYYLDSISLRKCCKNTVQQILAKMEDILFKKIVLIMSAVLISLCIASIAFAAPYSGHQFSLQQPDGTSISVRIYGDEFYQRVESLDGYTLIRDDSTQWICYANLDSTKSNFVSTGVRCTSNTKPSTLNIAKGLKEKKSVITKKAKAQKDVLGQSKFLKEASQVTQLREPQQKHYKPPSFASMPDYTN